MGLGLTVEVLLGTYNGGQFVRQQIASILNQDYDNLTVLARDDGSIDDTRDILNEYSERFADRFKVVGSSLVNGGFLNNFLALMKASTADYICFSDQDDVWLPDKITRSKHVMNELEQKWGAKAPLLVFTDLRVVDEHLDTLADSYWERMGIEPERIENLTKLLGSSVVTGCTIMANRALIDMACRMPKEACLHDRWLSLLASTLGKAGFVREPTVLYRQHGHNAIGVGKHDGAKSIRERFGRFAGKAHIGEWQSNQEQAAALLKVHGAEIAASHREVLNAFVRCETSGNPFVRVVTFLWRGFYSRGLLSKIAVPMYLLRKKAS